MAELRPKWCIFAGSKGTHTVFICTIPDNFKNMADASNFKKYIQNIVNPIRDYSDCLKLVMCIDPQPVFWKSDNLA